MSSQGSSIESYLVEKLQTIKTRLIEHFGNDYAQPAATRTNYPNYENFSNSSHAIQSNESTLRNNNVNMNAITTLVPLLIPTSGPSTINNGVIINNITKNTSDSNNITNISPRTVTAVTTAAKVETEIIETEEEKKKKKKNDETDKTVQLLAGAGLVILSFTGTYIVAKDEYMRYYLSEIDKLFASLKETSKFYNDKNNCINFILKCYQEWIEMYTARTKRTLVGKIGCVGSGAASLGGLAIASTGLIWGGVIGATVCGCYLLWRHLTTKELTEKNMYMSLQSRIDIAIGSLIVSTSEPSAPNEPNVPNLQYEPLNQFDRIDASSPDLPDPYPMLYANEYQNNSFKYVFDQIPQTKEYVPFTSPQNTTLPQR